MGRSVRRAATIAAVALSSLAALAVVAVVVGTRALESYLRSEGVQELSQQLGRPVSVAGVEARKPRESPGWWRQAAPSSPCGSGRC